MPATLDFETLECQRVEELAAVGLTEEEARAIALDEWETKIQHAMATADLAAVNKDESPCLAPAEGMSSTLPATESAAPALAELRQPIRRDQFPTVASTVPHSLPQAEQPHKRRRTSLVASAAAHRTALTNGGPQSDGTAHESDEWLWPGREQANTKTEDVQELCEEDGTGELGCAVPEDSPADTYPSFRHSRFVPVGGPHPDWLWEPAAISRIAMPPLSPDDPLRIPRRVVSSGCLSSPQLEAIAYAARRFRVTLPDGRRAGYYLGDGTGTGKGRIIAALFWHLWNEGARRHVWFSASSDLLEDARRDLNDLGAPIPVAFLGDMPYGKLVGPKAGRALAKNGLTAEGDGVLFATYSLLVASKASGAGGSRLDQIVEWLGGAGARGMIAFDEAHKAKNSGAGTSDPFASGASKTGTCVTALQQACPAIACLYASATGATEIRHLGYMERLGLVGLGRPHRSFADLQTAVERGGLAAMELVAITMRAEGMLSCRALSFRGASFGLRVVELDSAQTLIYTKASALWQRLFCTLTDLLRQDKKRAQELFGRRTKQTATTSTIMRHFWAVQQRFFRQLLVCFKVDRAVSITKDALTRGEQVVIAMWSTGEAQTEWRLMGGVAQDEGKAATRSSGSTSTSVARSNASMTRRSTAQAIDDFVCGLEVMVERLLDHSFEPLASSDVHHKALQALRGQLAQANLPANPLDRLIQKLGGPDQVAELTGRTRRLLAVAGGGMVLEERAGEGGAPERVNVAEQCAFQEGRKRVAIITEAASAGISLHSERRPGASQARRYMLTLEIPWEADKAVQQLGRVHRSNQAQPPRFAVLLTGLGGECRFASCIARRMRLLGAITRGDRTAAADVSGSLAEFDLQNRYGKRALDNFYTMLRAGKRYPIQLGCVGRGKKFTTWESFCKAAEVALTSIGIRVDTEDKFDETLNEGKSLNTFLNRILMLPPDLQNSLFECVHALYSLEVRSDQAAGNYDGGLETLNKRFGQRVKIRLLKTEVLFTDPGTKAETTYVQLQLDHGIDWAAAKYIRETRCEEVNGDGFYWWHHWTPPLPVLAVAELSTRAVDSDGEEDEDQQLFILHTPLGVFSKFPGSSRRITVGAIRDCPELHAMRAPELARMSSAWAARHESSAVSGATAAERQIRFKEEHVLGGSILNVWGAVSTAVTVSSNNGWSSASSSSAPPKLPLMRATPEGASQAVVGVRVHPGKLNEVRYALLALLKSREEEVGVASKAEELSGPTVNSASGASLAPRSVPVPSFELVHTEVKAYLSQLPGQSDATWCGWGQVHAFLLARGLADNSADCVIAVQHWVEELLRLRVLEHDEVTGGIRIRPVVNRSGWYVPPPKPKPLPKRARGARGRGRGRGTAR